MDDKVLLAKRNLYSLLLNKEDGDLTENELEIMCLLSKDKQIQDFLNEKAKNEN